MKETVFQTSGPGGGVPVVAPALTPMVQGTNGQVALPNAASTTILAANANRRYAEIINNSGVAIQLAFGGAASALTYHLANGASFVMGTDPAWRQYLGDVRAFQASGGAVNVNVLEMI